jgi:hypothetical protein
MLRAPLNVSHPSKAEVIEENTSLLDVDPSIKAAVLVEGAPWTWHQSPAEREREKEKEKERAIGRRHAKKGGKHHDKKPEHGKKKSTDSDLDSVPFGLNNVSLHRSSWQQKGRSFMVASRSS